jgi:pyruvate formate lyase activating enzyme
VVFRGWQHTSLIEYPGRIATVLFAGGCSLRCPWCYNPALALGRADEGGIEEDAVLARLAGSRKLYQAVVVTGGEPCLSPGLEGFLRRTRHLGLLAGLETNGTRPRVLARLLEQGLLDYVALDIKAPPDAGAYARATGADTDGVVEQVSASLSLLIDSAVEAELRTTVVPGIHGREELLAIAAWLAAAGWPVGGAARAADAPRRRWVLQQFVPGRTLDPKLAAAAPCERELLEAVAAQAGPGVELRGI